MWTYWAFEDKLRDQLPVAGLDWTAIEAIFLGKAFELELPRSLNGCPAGQLNYLRREYRAAETSFAALRKGAVSFPDPWWGDSEMPAIGCAMQNMSDATVYGTPLIYCCGSGSRRYYAVSYGLIGRVSQIIFPDLRLVIYDLSLHNAQLMISLFEANIESLSPRFEIRASSPLPPIVGIVDQVHNYGHHMINHLSGIERLIADGLHQSVQEIWVAGTPFFGQMENLFPEIASKLKTFHSNAEMAEAITQQEIQPVRIGSNVFQERTRKRIVALSGERFQFPAEKRRFPLIAITIRGEGRKCLNLADVVAHLHRMVSAKFPDVGYVLDGWVYPEPDMVMGSSVATAISTTFISRMRLEMSAAESVVAALPAGTIVRNLIGQSILNSIAGIQDVSVYFSHCGTLQHKIAFLTSAPGLVHGPTTQMRLIDTGVFSTESGVPPTFVNAANIADVAGSGGPRGAGFDDYVIADIDKALQPMLEISHNICKVVI